MDIAGTNCPIDSMTDTQIVCITEAHKPSVKTKIKVEVGTNGIATQVNHVKQFLTPNTNMRRGPWSIFTYSSDHMVPICSSITSSV